MACGSMGAPMAAPNQTSAAMPMDHSGGCGARSGATTAEQNVAFKQLFNQLDKNGNGSIEMQEFIDFLQGSIIENGMQDQMRSDQQETINGKTPTSQAASSPEAGPAGQTYDEIKAHGGHGHHSAMGDTDHGAMAGSCAGPAVAPVAPAMCGAA